MGITQETRREAYDHVLETVETRQLEVLTELKKCPGLTANELASRLWKQGRIPKPERNFVHPRLTELVQDGQVEVVGKKTCTFSGKRCAIYVPVGLEGRETLQGRLF